MINENFPVLNGFIAHKVSSFHELSCINGLSSHFSVALYADDDDGISSSFQSYLSLCSNLLSLS